MLIIMLIVVIVVSIIRLIIFGFLIVAMIGDIDQIMLMSHGYIGREWKPMTYWATELWIEVCWLGKSREIGLQTCGDLQVLQFFAESRGQQNQLDEHHSKHGDDGSSKKNNYTELSNITNTSGNSNHNLQ